MGASTGNAVVNGHGSSNAAKYNLPSHFIGGNHLDAAPPGLVRDFVAKHGGHSVISSVCFSSRGRASPFEDGVKNTAGLI